jgi:hypothetical protein
MADSARGRDLLEEFHSTRTALEQKPPSGKGEGGYHPEKTRNLEL